MFDSIELLIAKNNGFFKSEKQASFLIGQLSKEDGNVKIGSTYGNSFIISYFHDENGITKKEQYNCKTSKTIVLWERVIEGRLSIQQEKLLKTLKRKLNKARKSLENRIKQRLEYPNYINQVGEDFCGNKEEYCEWLKKLNENGIISDQSDIDYLENKIKDIY